MPGRYVVDTHAVIWFLEGNSRLSAVAKGVMQDVTVELFIPMIVLAECCWMIEHFRTSVPSTTELLRALDLDPRVVVVPLDRAVLEKSLAMAAIDEMHDRQVVATALVLQEIGAPVTVLTKDSTIQAAGLIAAA